MERVTGAQGGLNIQTNVEPFPAQDGSSNETFTQSRIDISISNETLQNILGSIVQFWRIFEIFFISKIWTC